MEVVEFAEEAKVEYVELLEEVEEMDVVGVGQQQREMDGLPVGGQRLMVPTGQETTPEKRVHTTGSVGQM